MIACSWVATWSVLGGIVIGFACSAVAVWMGSK
jgi:hypothetical protein